MKIFGILLIVVLNLLSCNFRSLSYTASSGGKAVAPTPTSITNPCVEENYRHKTEAELAAMTPTQIIGEEVKRQLYANELPGSAEYWQLTHKYIRLAGVRTLPKLTEYIRSYDPMIQKDESEYDPKGASECNIMRFLVASITADHLDNFTVKLRATNEGRTLIEALERAVERMRSAGFETDYKGSGELEITLIQLRGMKGNSVDDIEIRNTLRARHNIEMTDDELREFCDFLAALDPTYPGWSEVDEGGPPYLKKESKRYYEAYLKFRASKSKK